jgi:predicted NBD/HSP70 family sugar kinase
LLLASLLRAGPMSRADLARETGLTAAASSSVVAALIEDGLIEEVGTRSVGVGKPATLVDVIADARHVVSLQLSDDQDFLGAIVDLTGKVVHRESVDRDGAVGDRATERVVGLARSLVQRAERPLLGIGCGSPGIVDDTGTVLQAVDLHWENEPLADRLRTATGLTAAVVNDANAAALGEYSFGSDPSDNLVLVRVARGVGAGIVLHGELFVGDHFAAGEIGHVTVSDVGELCGCGRVGCLETFVSAPLLAAQLTHEPSQHAETLAAAGRHLGLALATVIGTLDVNQVVLSGPIALLDDRVRVAAIETIKRRSVASVRERVELSLSTLGDDDVLLGAAALVQRNELGVA